MHTRLHRISEFSKLTQLSPKTLRKLDGLGILRPALVDESNGYRYYKDYQMPLAHRIRSYSAAGFGPLEIRSLMNLESTGGIESVRDILFHRQKEAEHRAAQLQELRHLLAECAPDYFPCNQAQA